MGLCCDLSRRRFFQGAIGAGAAAASAVLLGSRGARAFGEAPASAQQVMLPEELRVTSILELFLFGGVSQYESFYTVPTQGDQDGTGWWLHVNSGEIDQAVADCGFSGPLTQEFGADSHGEKVHLGPFTAPIRARDDLLDRMRICVTAHPALAHEVAVPLALTGRRLAHFQMAGLGTHIQRYFQDIQGDVTRPVSYVLLPSNEIIGDLGRAAYSVGVHNASAAPLPLVIDQASNLKTLLARGAVGENAAAYDKLVEANLERFRRRLKFHGTGDPLRAPRFDDTVAAAEILANAPEISAALDPQLLQALPGQSCGFSTEVDTTTMSLRLAAHLLTHPTAPARYVCVLDGGIVPTLDAGGYDTHQQDCALQARNVTQALSALTSIINTPGENDPNKLDLDKTLVIINSEFGRTPGTEGSNGGRGHWPFGFPVVFMGGPIRSSAQNVGIYGATGGDAKAIESLNPQDHRIGALMAMGIWPFESESFNVADVGGSGDENEAAETVRTRVLGV